MKCPFCLKENTFPYFQACIPNIPAACPESMLGKVKIYPFEARLCPDCLLGFNATKLDDQELRSIYDNYLHISPMNGIGCSKYEGMITLLTQYYSRDDRIVEIGCAEGYLLNELKKKGYKYLLGVEPSPQANQARLLGLHVDQNYFDENTYKDEVFDGFYLMHVFEHFDNPFSILSSMKDRLSRKGKIIIEVPDFCGYQHQHLFFYNLPFLSRLSQEKGLKIIRKDKQNGALRVVLARDENEQFNRIKNVGNPEGIIKHAHKLYGDFKKKARKLNFILENNLGKTVFWWGAGSASVVYFNQINPVFKKKTEIRIVDGDKNKWGYYISGPEFKVHSYETIKNKTVDWLVVASSFYGEIKNTMRDHNIHAKNIAVLE